jgi:hypothetical protein
MAKILVADHWYQTISSTQRYEAEFESIILTRSEALFPGLTPARFRKVVHSSTDSAIPDYALIDHRYLSWWIVEVELSSHSLDSHVIPQVRTFCDATYGEEEAEYLCRANPSMDSQKVFTLLRGRPPSVLVVVNEACPEWRRPLEALGARLAVFEVFRSELDRYVFRMNGYTPSGSVASATRCRADRSLPFFLRVESPNLLEGRQQLIIEHQGSLTEWERVQNQDTVWIHPRSSFRIRSDIDYEIAIHDDGTLRMSIVPRGTPAA